MWRKKIVTVLPRLLNRIGYFKNRIYIRRVQLYSRNWRIPVIDYIGYSSLLGEDYEKWIFNLFIKINQINAINIFLDVGINTGQSLISIKTINPTVQYYGFEPNPICIFYVEYLAKLNKLSNINLICLGLGDKSSILNLNSGGSADSRSTFNETNAMQMQLRESRTVPIYRLDQLKYTFTKEDNILLKVDVEGFEFEVFSGSIEFIRSYYPILVFEVLPHGNIGSVMDTQHNLYAFLTREGYTMWRVNHNYTFTEIKGGFFNESDYLKTDYLGIPENRKFIQKLLNEGREFNSGVG
jgi:FkbM family methyltransferase